MTDLISPKVKFEWTAADEYAFQQAKEAVSKIPTLAFPEDDAETRMCCDASDSGVGAVLEQLIDGEWMPIEFFSSKFSPTELNYSTFDRELLAAYLAVRHFRWFLTARKFTLFSDHKPLVSALFRVGEPWSPRQARHLSYILEFTNDVQHLPGKENIIADVLSRDTINTLQSVTSIPMSTFARSQPGDDDCKKMQDSPSLRVQPVKIPCGMEVLVDASTGRPRILVPADLRRRVIQQVHNLAHPGVRGTRRLAKKAFLWP